MLGRRLDMDVAAINGTNNSWKTTQTFKTHCYLYSFSTLLLGFSKGNTRVEISVSFFFSFSHSLQVLNTYAQQFHSDEHMAWCNGGQRKVYAEEDHHNASQCETYNCHFYKLLYIDCYSSYTGKEFHPL